VPVPVSITVDDMADGVTSDLTVDAQGNISVRPTNHTYKRLI
jgi:hypothetical protein